MKILWNGKFKVAVTLVALIYATSGSAENAPAGRHPDINFSVVAPDLATRIYKGPLFNKAVIALHSTQTKGSTVFENSLTKNAELQFINGSGEKPVWRTFDKSFVLAASLSCLGPFSFDEGTEWVQLSWVCRTDAKSPISNFLKFNESSELSLTVWFEGDKIKKIDANEPVPQPGRDVIAMDAVLVDSSGQMTMRRN